MESDKLIEAMARAIANVETEDGSGPIYEHLHGHEIEAAATAALKALRDTLGYDPQAAFNAGLERAAELWEHHKYNSSFGEAIRAEKEKPQ